ncbi:MBL fold metallo-hydrolase [Halothiobacillus sp.]|jgi:glyoxylase-like metal-dependent hydrolase (beta-lactamase superfamily II)|uniref:MBL fold metallo-hydrolase n=1 Tax=Halothiobacillus sp. TaxID=1891311 RepID=UPI002635265F|nr:MBL fold metallo-hydrolase [Halothiobacillus sp.]MDD4966909.1 MBL fold metallo-hydrolase [Halothiobacillus sp.]
MNNQNSNHADVPTAQNLQDEVRRDLLKRLLGISALSLMTPELLQQAAMADTAGKAVMGPVVPDVKPTKLAENVYLIHAKDKFPTPQNKGFFTSIMFIVTEKGVVAIDPSASVRIGEMAIRMIKSVTDKPVIAVINTHYHGDHWMGNQAFAEAYPGIPLYSMKESAEAIKNVLGEQWIKMLLRTTDNETVGTRIVPPTHYVKDGDVLDFGDRQLTIHHLGKCHTPYDLIIEISGTPIVHMGDVIMDHRMAGMGDDEGSFIEGIKVLHKIKERMPDRLYVPAHGNPGKGILDDEINLFETIYNTANKAQAENKSIKEATLMVKATPFMQEYSKTTPDYEDSVAKWTSIAYLEAQQANF